MGSAAWIGIKGSSRQDVLDRTALIDTGRDDPENRTRFSLAELPSGWLILFTRDDGYLTPERLAALSADGSAFSCNLSTVTMFSEAHGYADGKPPGQSSTTARTACTTWPCRASPRRN